ncbi:hypothetical protein VP01_2489g1 [Puccinia sorghi]|uniref:alpha-1,2-Mannosidase n=1 Tax=Puccinia sorghi TaxID=27349 RepID=A0A0L6V5V3_9BASI|nr:hypothetical protein VP01_2489g1 [Puccinia sorghi]
MTLDGVRRIAVCGGIDCFRLLLSLAIATGLGLYLFLGFYSPILHGTPHLPSRTFREAQIGTPDGLSGAEVADLRDTGALVMDNDILPQLAVPDLNRTYTPDEIMSLPILHSIFEDALDPRNGFKPLRDSISPWNASNPSGAMLLQQLSRNRFPPPESIGLSHGSKPPPIPIWPRGSILKEKDTSLKHPIDKEKILGLNTSYVWKDRQRIAEGKLPKVQWLGFDRPDWETPSDRSNRLERQGWVRRGFQHVWEGYKAKAWGHDELKPVSGLFEDDFAGWGATLIDCLWFEWSSLRKNSVITTEMTIPKLNQPDLVFLPPSDTLLIMNLTREYNFARAHVKAVDWSYVINNQQSRRWGGQPKISFFETVIRCCLPFPSDLGGLISAYDLSGDHLMLQRAEDLAEWILPAFGTSSGFPMSHYQLGSITSADKISPYAFDRNPLGQKVGRVVTADVGSLTLEFTRLSQLTSHDYYYDLVQKITDTLNGDQWVSPDRMGTLFPIYINPDVPEALSEKYSMVVFFSGAMVDSYYEYLVQLFSCFLPTSIKQHQLLRGTKSQYSKMYTSVIESARAHLMKTYDLEPPGGKNFTVLGDVKGGVFSPVVNHLICYSGAMMGLGARLLNRQEDLDLALRYVDTCAWAYESTRTGVGPDLAIMDAGDRYTRWQPVHYKGKTFRRLKPNELRGPKVVDSHYLGRPETIESVYYMWRITGDRRWQDRGWRMFTSWMESCTAEYGVAGLQSVNYLPPMLFDKQESFVLAETFKYYFLLFSDPELISLDDYVFNTEAHPFRIDTPGKPIQRYWEKSEKDIGEIYDPPGVNKSERGYGTFLQQWARVDLDKLSESDRLVYNRVMGFQDNSGPK